MQSGAVALSKLIQDIVGINHYSMLYLVYVLLSATVPFWYDWLQNRIRVSKALLVLCSYYILLLQIIYTSIYGIDRVRRTLLTP